MERETVLAEVRARCLEPEDVADARGGVILDGGFPGSRPQVLATEHTGTGPLRERLPIGSLEQSQEGRLIDVPERIAIVRMHLEFHRSRYAHPSFPGCGASKLSGRPTGPTPMAVSGGFSNGLRCKMKPFHGTVASVY